MTDREPENIESYKQKFRKPTPGNFLLSDLYYSIVKPNLRLFNIKVRNIEEMTSFYNDILDRTPDEVESGRLVEYKFEGSILGLYNPKADSVGSEKIIRGNNCVPAFKLGEDFESEMDRIKEITDLEYVANEKGHRWFVFKDPEENKVEMYRGSV